MNEYRCHSPACWRLVDYSGDYCSVCDDPRTGVEKLQDKYVQGELDELEFELGLERVLQ